MSEFKIGEIAIYVRPGSAIFGKDVTIISALVEFSNGIDDITGLIYEPFIGYFISCGEINSETGEDRWCAEPRHLKKKQHKRDIDQLVSWSDCLWKPNGVSA